MRVVSAAEIDRVLDYPGLIEAIREAFRGGVIAPPRHHHAIPRAGAADATLHPHAGVARRRTAASSA